MSPSELGSNLVPYKMLLVCSNELYDGAQLLSIGSQYPLIVGKGVRPVVWLQGLRQGSSGKLEPVVTRSTSVHPAFRVVTGKDDITVFWQNTRVLHIKSNGEIAEIDVLDLRPLGWQVHGNKRELKIGANSFSSNKFRGMVTVFHMLSPVGDTLSV